MIIVQKGNVVLRVKDDLKKYYLDSGYNVINENGDVIEKTVPTDVITLQAEYRKHIEEIKSLKAKIATLEKSGDDKPAKRRKASEE